MTFTIFLQDLATHTISPSMICRFETEADARAYAVAAIAEQGRQDEIVIHKITSRP